MDEETVDFVKKVNGVVEGHVLNVQERVCKIQDAMDRLRAQELANTVMLQNVVKSLKELDDKLAMESRIIRERIEQAELALKK